MYLYCFDFYSEAFLAQVQTLSRETHKLCVSGRQMNGQVNLGNNYAVNGYYVLIKIV